ncbi:MAG: aldolase/citrate lyase family protein [Gemmatimonadota bacterium]
MTRFKEVLESRRPALGAAILYECPELIESLAGQDWDWIWLDGQHALRQHTWLEHLRACEILGADAVLRLPGDDWHLIGTALDWGAWNLMIPVVESAEQARAIARAAHFPPLGARSASGTRPHVLHGRQDYIERARRWTTVIVQIETAKGLEQVEEIAAADGIDALFIGTGDLSLSLGIPLEERQTSPRIEAAVARVGQVARDCGKHAGLICAPEDLPRRRQQGYTFFSLVMVMRQIADLMKGVLEAGRAASR